MSTAVTLNGVSYSIPITGEGSWGTNVTAYLVALSTGTLSKAGGSFTLTADADFGASFGLKSIYYKSRGTTSTTGVVRLANAESVGWRNAGNSADYLLKVNSSNILEFNGSPIVTLALGSAYTVLQMNAGATAYSWATPTGTGAPVLATSATLVTPALGTPSAIVLTNGTGLPVSSGISGLGTGIATFLATPSSSNLIAAVTDETGSGALVFANTPTLVTPALGVATATSINGTTIPSSKTLVVTTDKLSVHASTSSSELAGIISDETGSGALVFADTPTLVTPVLGAATATSINKMIITAPASSSTFAVANNKSAIISNSLTFAGTDGNTITFPSGSATVMTLSSADSIVGTKTFTDASLKLAGISSGASTLKASPAASTYVITLPAATDTLVGLATSDTLTNKTLTSPTINGATIATSTIKTGSTIGDTTDTTKAIGFTLSGATTAKTLTLISAHTNDRSITFPDATDTIVGKATTDTLTNKSLTAPIITTGSYIDMQVQSAIRFNDDSGGDYVAVKAPTGVTTHTLLLPATQGSASTVLTNDGSGNLSWGASASSTLNQYNTDIGNSSNSRTPVNTNLLGDIKGTTSSQTYAVTSAAPGVFTISGHGLLTGDKAYVTVTQNGFTANTTYYVHKIDANTFHLSTTLANATGAVYITSSGTTAGTIVSGGLVLTSGTKGTVTNDSATAGYVGEYIESVIAPASAVALVSATGKTVTSISLTTGDWDVTVIAMLGGVTTGTYFDVGVNTTTNTMPADTTYGNQKVESSAVSSTSAYEYASLSNFRVSVATTTIYYLVVVAGFTVSSSPAAFGRISARRMR